MTRALEWIFFYRNCKPPAVHDHHAGIDKLISAKADPVTVGVIDCQSSAADARLAPSPLGGIGLATLAATGPIAAPGRPLGQLLLTAFTLAAEVEHPAAMVDARSKQHCDENATETVINTPAATVV